MIVSLKFVYVNCKLLNNNNTRTLHITVVRSYNNNTRLEFIVANILYSLLALRGIGVIFGIS